MTEETGDHSCMVPVVIGQSDGPRLLTVSVQLSGWGNFCISGYLISITNNSLHVMLHTPSLLKPHGTPIKAEHLAAALQSPAIGCIHN